MGGGQRKREPASIIYVSEVENNELELKGKGG